MKALKKLLVLICGLMVLLSTFGASADDGFSTSYTYGYDYWEDVQESPDAYKVKTVIDSETLGLDNLNNTKLRKPQSLFVKGQDLYVCDTGNNRILQIRHNNGEYTLVRIIDSAYDTAEDYAHAKGYYTATEKYEKAIEARLEAEKKLAALTESEQNNAAEEAAAEGTAQEDASGTEPAAEAEAGADETAAAEESPATGETAEAGASPAAEEPAGEDEIEAARQAVEEAKRVEEARHEEAVAAEESAKANGCRIWQYDCWQENEDGSVVTHFKTPNDIAVDDAGNIYIADTDNYRVLKMDKDCNLLWEFSKPLDATFDQSQNFLPKKVVVDVAERVYALCQNINKGLVKFEANGVFSGFIGANPVTVSMTEYIWKRYFQTKEQRAQSASFVPTEYENIYIDDDGFIYATTIVFVESDLRWDNAKPIRRLNSVGSDILIKNDKIPPIGDLEWIEGGGEATGPSRLVDITAMQNDMYIVLDKIRGRLFGYDSQGVMLWAFGTKGNVDGAFNGAVSLEHMGYDLLVLDQLKNSITVFETTEYGSTIYSAIETYLDGMYDESADLWKDVLKHNADYSLAFRGIGRAVLRQNKYQEAMEWFKLAHDRENYGRAFKLYRKEWVEKNIWWILLIVAVLLIVPLVIGRVKKTKWEVVMHEHSKVRK